MAVKKAGEPAKPSPQQRLAARTQDMIDRERQAKERLREREKKMAEREAAAKKKLG